jgi:hypothetical protein
VGSLTLTARRPPKASGSHGAAHVDGMLTLTPLYTLCELAVSTHAACGTVVMTHNEPRAALAPEQARAVAAALIAAADAIEHA